jgi:hypothetical protein
MGLLDDAIREHMELKRLRGADPSEVARQEQDALGPVTQERDAERQGAEEEEEATHVEPAVADRALAEDDPPAAPQPARGADFANVGQETAELDMRTVLDEHEQHEIEDAQGQGHPAEPAAAPDEEDGPVEDVLEETPDFLRDTPEQERLWFEQQPPRDFDFDK